MKVFKYYRNAVIYPSLFVLFFCLVYALIHGYISDGLKNTAALLMAFIPGLIFALLMCGLSSTIFLCKIGRIDQNVIYGLMAWFLLPFTYMTVIFVYDIGVRTKFEFGYGNDFLYLLVMTIPFMIGLVTTWIKYRQELTIYRQNI